MSALNAVIVDEATGGNSSLSPLTASEQSALLGFVEAGGTALLFVDNSTYVSNAPAVNNSLLTPFGLAATGTLNGFQPSTIVNSANPIINGIAGTAAGFDTDYPGWFSSLGNTQELAILTANFEPDLAYLAPGALGTGGGAVIFFADSTYVGVSEANENTLILNSLALAVPSTASSPEPVSGLLFLAGGLILCPKWLRRPRP